MTDGVADLMKDIERILDGMEDELDAGLSPSPTGSTFAAIQTLFPNTPLLWNACKHMLKFTTTNDGNELQKALWYLQKEIERCKPSTSS